MGAANECPHQLRSSCVHLIPGRSFLMGMGGWRGGPAHRLEMRDCCENMDICGIGDLSERFRDNYSKTCMDRKGEKQKVNVGHINFLKQILALKII